MVTEQYILSHVAFFEQSQNSIGQFAKMNKMSEMAQSNASACIDRGKVSNWENM